MDVQEIMVTKFKKLHPKKGYIALYIHFPWTTEKGLIGKSVNIYRVSCGFLLVTDEAAKNNGFKPNNVLIDKINELEKQITELKSVQTAITSDNEAESSNKDRACGLAGYDVALTRRRSPVRIRTGPSFYVINNLIHHSISRIIIYSARKIAIIRSA